MRENTGYMLSMRESRTHVEYERARYMFSMREQDIWLV